jgi:hypothetical protein
MKIRVKYIDTVLVYMYSILYSTLYNTSRETPNPILESSMKLPNIKYVSTRINNSYCPYRKSVGNEYSIKGSPTDIDYDRYYEFSNFLE